MHIRLYPHKKGGPSEDDPPKGYNVKDYSTTVMVPTWPPISMV